MALILCSECGAKVSSFASECPNCGCPVEQEEVKKSTCPDCGTQFPEETDSCPNCGCPFKGNEEESFLNIKDEKCAQENVHSISQDTEKVAEQKEINKEIDLQKDEGQSTQEYQQSTELLSKDVQQSIGQNAVNKKKYIIGSLVAILFVIICSICVMWLFDIGFFSKEQIVENSSHEEEQLEVVDSEMVVSTDNIFTLLYATSSDGVVNVRLAPNPRGQKVGEIHAIIEGLGDGVFLENGSWYKVIASNGQIGYANSKILGKQTWYNGGKKALVAKANCPVYVECLEDGVDIEDWYVICKLKEGTIITDDYYEIEEGTHYIFNARGNLSLFVPKMYCVVKNVYNAASIDNIQTNSQSQGNEPLWSLIFWGYRESASLYLNTMISENVYEGELSCGSGLGCYGDEIAVRAVFGKNTITITCINNLNDEEDRILYSDKVLNKEILRFETKDGVKYEAVALVNEYDSYEGWAFFHGETLSESEHMASCYADTLNQLIRETTIHG